MIFLIVFLICVFICLAVGALSGVSDIRTMTIPNAHSLYVVASFFVAYIILLIGGYAHVMGSFSSHLISAAVTFLVTFVLFSLRIIGAGDSKFGTACALWFSVKYLPIFLFFMTLTGGILAAVALVVKRKKPFDSPLEGGWIDQVQGGADKVPYGVAIFVGTLFAFIYAGYFSPEVLSSFLTLGDVDGGS